MQLKSLRLFMAVAETGSFVAAAERLHTVQSNATTHVKKLEAELGTQLFDRNGRVRLTSAGQALAEYAARILNAHDDALAFFLERDMPSGRVRVGAMETAMALRLPPILADFHSRYPDVGIELRTGPSAELVTSLLEGRLDCAFVAGPLEHRRLHVFKVFSERLVLVSAQPLTRMPSTETLLSATFLAFRQGCSYRQRIELLLAAQGVSATRIVEFGTLDAMLGCVAAGMGYAVLPSATVEAHRERFAIHALALPDTTAEVDTCFAAPHREGWTPALARFADTLHHTVSESP